MKIISIIIVNWNARDKLKFCLKSVEKAIGHINCEIIVVDNKSTDGSIEMVSNHFPLVRLVSNKKNYGYGRGNNIGASYAKGDYFLFLNPDTVVTSKAINKMYEFLKKNPSAGACGPLIIDSSFNPAPPVLYRPLKWEIFGRDTFIGKLFPRLCFPKYTNPKSKSIVERLSGCAFLVRKSAFENSGRFDEKLFLFYEEADLFYRMIKNGWEIYFVPDAIIMHFHGASFSNMPLLFKETYIEKSSLVYFLKTYGRAETLLLNGFRTLSHFLYLTSYLTLFFIYSKNKYKYKIEFYIQMLRTQIKFALFKEY